MKHFPEVLPTNTDTTNSTRSAVRALPFRVWAGAVLWLVQPLYLIVELVTVSRVSASYSLLDNTISDAGAAGCTVVEYPWGEVPVCSPLSWLLNATAAVLGAALALGAVLLRRCVSPGRLRVWVVVFAFLNGVSVIATALVPLDVDLTLHSLVAMPQFLTIPVLLILLGKAVRDVSVTIAWSTYLTAVVSLCAAVAFVARIGEPQWGGLLERGALWPLYLAVVPVAVAFLTRPTRPEPDYDHMR